MQHLVILKSYVMAYDVYSTKCTVAMDLNCVLERLSMTWEYTFNGTIPSHSGCTGGWWKPKNPGKKT